MDIGEFEPQGRRDSGEGAESQEGQELNDATFEPLSYIEQSGGYQQAEAIQADFVNLVGDTEVLPVNMEVIPVEMAELGAPSEGEGQDNPPHPPLPTEAAEGRGAPPQPPSDVGKEAPPQPPSDVAREAPPQPPSDVGKEAPPQPPSDVAREASHDEVPFIVNYAEEDGVSEPSERDREHESSDSPRDRRRHG